MAAADSDAVAASVIIPTFNGEAYLERVLDAVHGQEFDGPVEVLVIDSGSTDRTLQIVRSRPWVRLHQIPNSEFGHGKTRNLGARLARGRLVAFLTQDAIPTRSSWLQELTAPLDGCEPAVAAVVGRQEPRAACFPLLKYEVRASFARLGPSAETTVVTADDAHRVGLEVAEFYSDVNSASRRDFLVETLPYRDVAYAEDRAFARDLLRAGYGKAYAPQAVVEHSNDLTLREYGKRIFDEAIGTRRIGHPTPDPGAVGWVTHASAGALRDTVKIVRDPDYGLARKLYWLAVNPIFHLVKWRNYRRANLVDLNDPTTFAKWSLDHERR